MHAPPSPLHPVIFFDLFFKWGINFITYNPTSSDGHNFIVVVMDYFTKWVEANPTF